MKTKFAAISAVALMIGIAAGADAQTVDTKKNDEKTDTTTVIVTARGSGTRTARQQNLQTVDAIGPRDLDSLPSANVADVLKRLPGVQVTYDNGEAQQPNIRGVGFIQTLIDGREVTTAGFRSFQIGDIPGDNVNSVAVYKTQSADQIEGGIGGIIDVRTKQPFDYKGFSGAASISGDYDGGSKKWSPQGTLTIGNSWDTSVGRMGVSLGLSHTSLDARSDFIISGYTQKNTLFDVNGNGTVGEAADNVILPGAFTTIDIHPKHTRDSGILNFQWAPSETLEFAASYMHSEYLDKSTQAYIIPGMPSANDAANYDDFTVENGTNWITSGTVGATTVTSQALWVKPHRIVDQFSVSGKWHGEKSLLSWEADSTWGKNNNDIFIFSGQTPATGLTFQKQGDPPFWTYNILGADLLNPAAYTNLNYADIINRATSDGKSARIDFAYSPEAGFFTSLQTGVRYSVRTSVNNSNGYRGQAVAGTFADYPGITTTDSRGTFIVPDAEQMADDIAFRSRLGLSADLPAFSQSSYFKLKEETSAIYGRALYAFNIGTVPVDGDVGVRVIETKTHGNAFAIGGASGVLPVETDSKYTDVLPSATLRAKLSDTLTLRATASKFVGRPTFAQLSPGISLSTGTNGNPNTGGGGNPSLRAFHATGEDLGLDWYFSRSGYIAVAVFHKQVEGFVTNRITQETYGGVEYNISRPVNGADGELSGIEFSYSHKFTFLPGWLSGLGTDINYTVMDSNTVSVITNKEQQFTGLAKSTWNLTAYYDRGPILFRVGYAINDPFINNDSLGTPLGGGEVFGRQDTMDATFQYRINDNLRFTVNVLNALQPRVGYYDTYVDVQPENMFRTYRRVQVGLKMNF